MSLLFSTEKPVSVEKQRKNALASKHFYLYYKNKIRRCQYVC